MIQCGYLDIGSTVRLYTEIICESYKPRHYFHFTKREYKMGSPKKVAMQEVGKSAVRREAGNNKWSFLCQSM